MSSQPANDWTNPDGPVNPLTHRVLPVVLLIVFLLVSVGAAWWVVSTTVSPTALAAQSNEAQEKTFYLRRLADPLHLLGKDYLWLLVLVLVLLVGFAYVIVLYMRDSQTVGWAWAAFLSTLRCVTYLVLAGVFLLPATQTWDRIETASRVAVLFDVSSSMVQTKDDIPSGSQTFDQMPARQDKVLALLTDDKVKLLPRLLEKNPVDLWRFGALLDKDMQQLTAMTSWNTERWTTFLKPDTKELAIDTLSAAEQTRLASLDEEARTKFISERLGLHQQLVAGTNLGGALEELLSLESNRSPLKQLQGIIVFSDGRSNQGSAQSFEEVQELTRKARLPIFAVAVGKDREPTRITITVLQAPAQTRGDDRFPVRIEVDGEGLDDHDVPLMLDITKVARDANGKEKSEDLALVEVTGSGEPTGQRILLGKRVTLIPEKLLHFVPGKPPHAAVEIPVDPAVLAQAAGKPLPGPTQRYELESGDWRFQARVPRDRQELFAFAEHLSDPAPVTVIKQPLRVLLFAGAPTREYQFVRSLLVREVDRGRAELSICLQLAQAGIVQDVPNDRLLKRFPNYLADEGSPDIKPEEKYYNLSQYDLILAFDPDWSRLNVDEAKKLEQWVDKQGGGLVLVGGPVNTVELTRRDNRERLKPILDLLPVILGDVRDLTRKNDRPWRLNFPGATKELEFLKLDETGSNVRAGWDEFFGTQIEPADKEGGQARGFYGYYPVEGRKPSATVIATYADPDARLPDRQEQPYLVAMRYGGGRVIWLGSGETWRLRQFHEAYHERFWTKLARYVAGSASKKKSRRGFLNLSPSFVSSRPIEIEAKLFGRDLETPLTETDREGKPVKPMLRLTPPAGAAPNAVPAKVEMGPKLQGANDGWFRARFELKVAGEYTVDLVIPDTGELLQGKFLVKEPLPEELENVRPDFAALYRLAGRVADVTDRLKEKDKTELRERLRQLQPPAGVKPEEMPRLFFDLDTATLIPDCLQTVREVKPSRAGYKDVWDAGVTTTVALGPSSRSAVEWSTVMLVIVFLLAAEWLTRKLLRLA